MNVYEEVHNLTQAIKESTEFKEFDNLRNEIEKDEELDTMIKEFQKSQMIYQTKQMSGETPDSDLMSQIQSMYAIIAAKPEAAEYLQAQARFSLMMKDVFEELNSLINIKF